jgi:hypothetical protein
VQCWYCTSSLYNCREATVVIMSSVDETRRKAQKPAATLSDALNMLEVRE